MTEEEKKFSAAQEGVRKCVERVFGVLFRRFKIMFTASELHSSADMMCIAKACAILHNMVVEVRREFYTGDGGSGLSAFFCNEDDPCDLQGQLKLSLLTLKLITTL